MTQAPDVENTGMGKIQRFWLQTKRIFKISTKPTKKEYMAMLKICLIGMAIIGGISFIVQLIASLVQPKPTNTETTSTMTSTTTTTTQ
jgi:protein translocase SEC61 complex gamma subunit